MWETLHKKCRVGLFQDTPDFAGDLEDSKSTSGGILCIFGSHTFVPISWMCKKQTSVSHSSTESEIIFLDPGFTGLRMDGIPALDHWELFIEVLQSSSNQLKKSKGKVQGDLLHDTPTPKPRLQFSTTIWNYATSIMFPPT